MSESPERGNTPDLDRLVPKNHESDSDEGPLPSAAEGKSDEVYEVQKILEHILSTDGFFLKVRWEGYGEDEDSWEPETDLKECAGEIVKEYMSKLTEKERRTISKFKRDMEAKELAKKKKSTTPKSKANNKKENKTNARIKEEIDSDNETPEKKSKYVESDDSFSEDTTPKNKSRTKKRGKSREDSFEPTEKKSRKTEKERKTVTTKAALKQYPSSARQAAIKHRQTWLNDSDSSDNEREEPNENSTSFDDEIKAKVQTKKRERAEKKEESQVMKVKKTEKRKLNEDREESELPEDDSELTQTSPHVTFKEVIGKEGAAEMVLQLTNTSENDQEARNGESSEWNIEGITQHIGEDNKTIIVLLANSSTGEKKAVSAYEGYKLAGWNLCKWLINRCSF